MFQTVQGVNSVFGFQQPAQKGAASRRVSQLLTTVQPDSVRFGKRAKQTQEALTGFRERVAALCDLEGMAALLSWDMETGGMPKKAADVRAAQDATLAAIHHEKLTAPELGRQLHVLREPKAFKSLSKIDQAMVRKWGKLYDDATKVPEDVVSRQAALRSKAHNVWVKARSDNNFSQFSPVLEELIGLDKQVTQLTNKPGRELYDAMLDNFEPGLTMSQLDKLFGDLRSDLVPLVQAIRKAPQEDFSFLSRRVDGAKLRTFVEDVLKDMGYDFNRGRLGDAAHPFSSGVSSPMDVRITVWKTGKRPTLDDALESLLAALHEGGHALFDLGASKKLTRTGLPGGSMGIHESQSRLWENQVGRSLPFWKHYYPKLQALFPKQLGDVPLDKFYRAVNQVKFSPIRVRADEVTYNLHIMLRYELEKAMTNSPNLKETLQGLPALWNQKMQEYVGITPENDQEGVLQDVHWSMGAFGYFPTYTLGTMFAAQLYDKAKEEIPGLEDKIAQGNLKELRQWLKQKIHKDGEVYTPEAIIQRSTGKALDASHFVNYLWEKFSQIYPTIQRPKPGKKV